MTSIYTPKLIVVNTNGNPMELMMSEYNNNLIYQTGNDNPKATKKIMSLK